MPKPSRFRPTHQNHINSDLYTEIKLSSIPYDRIMSISTTHAKTESSSMLTLRPSHFQPGYQNQVNFDHPPEN